MYQISLFQIRPEPDLRKCAKYQWKTEPE